MVEQKQGCHVELDQNTAKCVNSVETAGVADVLLVVSDGNWCGGSLVLGVILIRVVPKLATRGYPASAGTTDTTLTILQVSTT